MKGILLVDKPAGITSHDVVDHIRKVTGERRVGHTGTLDPAATGLLVLCMGPATRLSEHLTKLDKTYEGTMRLGVETDSYDLDGKILVEKPVPDTSLDALQLLCDKFVGEIMQLPPMVSAVKVGGRRLYKSARKGEVVEREPRPVMVHEFAITSYTAPEAILRVRCSRGTYVRGLCHDVGQLLGCGAVLSSLRRTWVGEHCVDNALPMADFVDRAQVESRLLPMEDALALPEVILRPNARRALQAGNSLGSNYIKGEIPPAAGWVQIKTESGRLVALGVVLPSASGWVVQPKRVLLD
jgi:tRNA pseudouridine55 synthase